MNLLQDIITYIRRIIKSPSNTSISDDLLIDYINRFWIMDVDARIQLFDLKQKYSFQTTPGVDRYNMPLYDSQLETDNQTVASYPVYQGFLGPAYINGIQVPFQTQKNSFFNIFPNNIQPLQSVAIGDGTAGPYTLNFPILSNSTPLNPPINAILRGHVNTTGIISVGGNIDPPVGTTLNLSIPTTSVDPAVWITSTASDGTNIVVTDSGQFLSTNQNYGLLMKPGKAPRGNTALSNGYISALTITGITQASQAVITVNNTYQAGQTVIIDGVVGMIELNGNTYTVVSATSTTITINVDSTTFTAYVSGGTVSSIQNMINYITGVAENVYLPAAVPSGVNINVQCYYFQSGLPRSILFYDNTLTLRSVPDRQYLVELDAYLSPCAFLSSTEGIPFGYMAEYIARGASRKILSDTGDVEQLQFYEPLFREQEMLVWKRSQRQWTATRTETIYSQRQGSGNMNSLGGSI